MFINMWHRYKHLKKGFRQNSIEYYLVTLMTVYLVTLMTVYLVTLMTVYLVTLMTVYLVTLMTVYLVTLMTVYLGLSFGGKYLTILEIVCLRYETKLHTS